MASWNYCWEKVAGEKGTLLLSEPGFTGLNDKKGDRPEGPVSLFELK